MGLWHSSFSYVCLSKPLSSNAGIGIAPKQYRRKPTPILASPDAYTDIFISLVF